MEYIIINRYVLFGCLFIYLNPLHSKLSLCLILADLSSIDMMPNTFSYYELKNATSNFHRDNKLGEGGFGPVYKVNIFLFVYKKLLKVREETQENGV
jgi:hypothetical protein